MLRLNLPTTMIGILLVAVILSACQPIVPPETSVLVEHNQTLEEIAGPVPASLDNFYPPNAPGPVYLMEMFALSGAFEGAIVDLQQGDTEGVQTNYEAFKDQYGKLAAMVPEWAERFPLEPVEALGQALASGDPAQVGPAIGQVGQVCGSCHVLSQVKVQQTYHWPDFEAVQITDPISGEVLHLEDYMLNMALAFVGIGNDLQQGQVDNARLNYESFSALFSNLPVICEQCHTTPRAYFVDESVQAMVSQLGEALAASSPDPEIIGQLSGGIGNESCFKCHLVHLPAAHAKARWERYADLFD